MPVGNGFKVLHPNGVYLNCRAIGENFTCYHNVTIGSKRGVGIPSVGNNVTVYAGAVIIGNVTLHDGCVVAANAFVNHDVEANTVVAGVPAKVIKRSSN